MGRTPVSFWYNVWTTEADHEFLEIFYPLTSGSFLAWCKIQSKRANPNLDGHVLQLYCFHETKIVDTKTTKLDTNI